MGHEVTLISAKGSPLAGQWRFLQGEEQDPEKQKFGQLTCHETHMPSWNSGEFQHYLMYRDIMENEFGDGQGVVWDSTWQAWSYMSAAGMNMKLDPNKDPVVVKPHPKMKICHTHHGMPNSRTPPPRIRYPRFIGVSTGHANLLENILKIPVRTVHNGIRLPDYKPDEFTRDGFMLSLNRITDEKGIHVAVDLCKRNRIPIKVVGDDTQVRQQLYVTNVINQCRDSDGFAEYMGLVDTETRNNLLSHCNGVIGVPDNYSSLSWIEAFGMYAVEGFAYGKPFLGVVNGGLRDIVTNGYNGYIEASPNLLDQYLTSDKLQNIPADNCRKTAETEFSVQVMTKNYISLFEKVMSDDPAGRW